MAEDFATKAEHEEFRRRIDRENERQNERLKELEGNIEDINRLALSTERLATSMEQMLEEQKAQGQRISKLESRDGEKWRGVIKTVATAVLSAVVGAVLTMLGFKV